MRPWFIFKQNFSFCGLGARAFRPHLIFRWKWLPCPCIHIFSSLHSHHPLIWFISLAAADWKFRQERFRSIKDRVLYTFANHCSPRDEIQLWHHKGRHNPQTLPENSSQKTMKIWEFHCQKKMEKKPNPPPEKGKLSSCLFKWLQGWIPRKFLSLTQFSSFENPTEISFSSPSFSSPFNLWDLSRFSSPSPATAQYGTIKARANSRSLRSEKTRRVAFES
jgi:hypothetical protein